MLSQLRTDGNEYLIFAQALFLVDRYIAIQMFEQAMQTFNKTLSRHE